jgi:hypothetical protein
MSNEEDQYQVKSVLLAILPKFPALVSIVCSSAIIRKVVVRTSTRKMQDRIMLGLSVCDVISSVNYFIGTWFIPKGSIGQYGPVYGASGNDVTCDISGILTQFAVASPMYNGTLACYYLFTIYFKMSERDLKKGEIWFHMIPISYAFLTSIIAVCLRLYGQVEWLCWIKPNIGPEDIETPAQKSFQLIQIIFLFGPIWACSLFQMTVMYLLFRKMRGFEENMKRYNISSLKLDLQSKMYKNTTNNSGTSENNRSSIPDFITPGKNTDVSKLESRLMSESEAVIQLRKETEQEEEGALQKDEEHALSDKEDSKEIISQESALEVEKEESQNEEREPLQPNAFPINLADEETTKVMEDEGNTAFLTRETEQSGFDDVEPGQATRTREKRVSVTFQEEEKTEIEPIDYRHPRGISFCDIDNEDRRSALEENRQDSFLPNMEDQASIAESADGDAPKINERQSGKGSRLGSSIVRMSKSFGSIMHKISGLFNRISLTNSDISKERLRIYKENEKSRQIAIQGMLYVCAFYISWLMPTVQRITELTLQKNFYGIQLLDTCLLPFQGFFNFLIYTRPGFRTYRLANPEVGFWRALWRVTFGSSSGNV